MLLGMDFLSKYRANLDLEKLTLTLNGKTMNVTFGTETKPSVNGCITRHFMLISRPAVWSLVSLSVYGFDGN
jgi:hypothetical protein